MGDLSLASIPGEIYRMRVRLKRTTLEFSFAKDRRYRVKSNGYKYRMSLRMTGVSVLVILVPFRDRYSTSYFHCRTEGGIHPQHKH